MRLTCINESQEKQLSALNAKVEALSMRDASEWEEAIDWGVPDYSVLCPADRRAITAPDFD